MDQERHDIAILMVEDDEAIRKMLGIFINRKFPDMPIHFAENGKRGIELFEAYAPAIVITDLVMPEMDGAEMASTIKTMKSDVKLIVVTGYGSMKAIEIFRSIGTNAFLTKPLEIKALISALEQCIAEIESPIPSAQASQQLAGCPTP